MEKPRLIDVGLPEKVLFVDNNYIFNLVKCKAGNDCINYSKKASELTPEEISLVKGELIKNNNEWKITWSIT